MATESTGQPEFAWRAHPAAERLPAAVAAGLVVGLFGAVVGYAFDVAWGLLSVAVLVASLNRFFFPSRYRIDAEGITAQALFGRRRLRWAETRRFVVDERGGFLATRVRRSWLDPYRGMHVLFGSARREVIERIRAHLPGAQIPGGDR